MIFYSQFCLGYCLLIIESSCPSYIKFNEGLTNSNSYQTIGLSDNVHTEYNKQQPFNRKLQQKIIYWILRGFKYPPITMSLFFATYISFSNTLLLSNPQLQFFVNGGFSKM